MKIKVKFSRDFLNQLVDDLCDVANALDADYPSKALALDKALEVLADVEPADVDPAEIGD